MEIPLPVVIAKEGEWFVAACPIMQVSLTNIPVEVPEGVLHGKASSSSTA